MDRENTKNKNFFVSLLILTLVTWGINYLRNITIGQLLFNIINDTEEKIKAIRQLSLFDMVEESRQLLKERKIIWKEILN
mgnify:CR=1 FL=1